MNHDIYLLETRNVYLLPPYTIIMTIPIQFLFSATRRQILRGGQSGFERSEEQDFVSNN